MKRLILISLLSSLSMMLFAQTNVHQFTVKDIMGKDFPLEQFKGKKILIVNTASKCGLTPQYADLQELYTKYGEKLEIVGFPANNFARQEPGTNDEIREFCTDKYEVSFPMMSKISVKGDDIHPLYEWLTQKAKNGVEDSKVSWNFQKYLIDENGQLITHFSPKTKPMDPKILEMLD